METQRADAVRNRRLALEAATDLLGEGSATPTVEAIARRAGLGAGTVVRAFGGKDALLDAAVSGLLAPIVERAEALRSHGDPEQQLQTFLAELIAFQSAHYAIAAELDRTALPATSELRGRLEAAVEAMLADARAAGVLRSDIAPAEISDLVTRLMHAIVHSGPVSDRLADAFVTVLIDGLRPRSRRAGAPR